MSCESPIGMRLFQTCVYHRYATSVVYPYQILSHGMGKLEKRAIAGHREKLQYKDLCVIAVAPF